MTATTTRPPAPHEQTPPAPTRHTRPSMHSAPGLMPLLTCVVMLIAAAAPLATVFAGEAWGRPVGGALLVAVGLSWGLAQTRLPAVVPVIASFLGWAVFVTVTFARATAELGFLPSAESRARLLELAADGRELVMTSVAPVAPEPALVLFAVTGVWVIAAFVSHLVFRGARALAAVVAALVLFTSPLPVAAAGTDATVLAAAFMASVALLLYATNRERTRLWGAAPPGPDVVRPGSAVTGVLAAGAAIMAGLAFGTALPGADAPPVYEFRSGSGGGTNVTTNPMVGLRPSLTAQDRGPVMFVTSERPVYLRTTALDRYDAQERWTRERIVSTPIAGGRLQQEIEPASATGQFNVDVEITTLRGLLVPVPYPPLDVSGSAAGDFRYDPSVGTVTMRSGEELASGDSYTVAAALPPSADRVSGLEGFAPDSSLTDLPDNVPDDVVALARSIVSEAGATTPFAQALAIQEELRTWTYSLEPPAGHGGEAMQTFIDTRIGYCEQFAGTMAVMLRSLDVPARVAVGFGPGTLVDEEAGLWSVSNANAHAWVEVLFPGHGWVAFEPTPRSDGNVLVPDASTLAPEDVSSPDGNAIDEPADADPEPVDPEETEPADEALVPETPDAAQPDDAVTPAPTDSVPGAGFLSGLGAFATAAAALTVSIGAAAVIRGRRHLPDGPRGRILRARGRVEDLARGFGVHPRPSETDAEYLVRVSGRLGNAAAARALATDAALARFAPDVTHASAERAEAAANALSEEVRGSLRRALKRARGTASRGLRALARQSG